MMLPYLFCCCCKLLFSFGCNFSCMYYTKVLIEKHLLLNKLKLLNSLLRCVILLSMVQFYSHAPHPSGHVCIQGIYQIYKRI